MNRIRYLRAQIARLIVRASEDGQCRVDVSIGDDHRYELPHEPGEILGHLPDEARAEFAAVPVPPLSGANPFEMTFPIVTVAVRDRRCTGADWESWVRTELGSSHVVIRASDVRPRVADLPLTYPLRILEVRSTVAPEPPAGIPLNEVLRKVFGSSDFSDAADVAFCSLAEILDFRRIEQWATAEVLHFDHLPAWTGAALFDLTTSWQTRLVVIEGGEPERLTKLASELTDLGGPPVLVCPHGSRLTLYGALVHDAPLDFIAHQISWTDPVRYFGGAGREELLRVSRIVDTLTGSGLKEGIAAALAASSPLTRGPADRAWFSRAPRIILEGIYEERGDYAKLIGELEILSESEGDPQKRVQLKLEIARLRSEVSGDFSGAFAALAAALKDDPSMLETRSEIERVADASDGWKQLAALYDEIAAGLSDAALARDYWMRVAAINERLGQIDDAAEGYKEPEPRDAGGGGRGGGGGGDDGGSGGVRPRAPDTWFGFESAPRTAPQDDFLGRFLEGHRDALDSIQFDHESTGTVPSARIVRDLMRSFRSARRVVTLPGQADGSLSSRRYVNALLHHPDVEGRAPLDPEYGVLSPGDPIHLAIQIGARAARLRTIGSTAFVEEAVLWKAGEEETLVELGVTPLDFELLGAPVQRLRLPRSGESDIATFTLVPRAMTRIPGVARLRFCLYVHGALVESFRLAVAVETATRTPLDPPSLAQAFAAALDVPPEDPPLRGELAGGYLTRLEYAAFDLESPEAIAPRRFSFFVNDSAGQAVVTFKGDDLFSGEVSGNLPGNVSRARATLKRVSYDVGPGGIQGDGYRYLFDGELNRGSDEGFAGALCDLAADGWELYTSLVPARARERFAEMLTNTPEIVHAGHLDLKRVIPWGLVYMRPYDVGRAAPLACTAPLADPSIGPCGNHPDCPLHEAQQKARAARGEPPATEDTIACPRFFLGFRHMIEVPAQQVKGMAAGAGDGGEGIPPPMPRVVPYDGKVRTLVGYNASLPLAPAHVQTLQAKLPNAAFDPKPLSVRNALVDALRREADVVYLYCHALESFEDAISKRAMGPHLLIEKSTTVAGRITPGNISAIVFPRHPVVFMNGCGTVGFSPYAPAEFVTSFIRDSGASAVIGTEATVWEGLAIDMALAFFESFVGEGKTAGEALLAARLALLQKRNPLGLAYTLYGPADLKLQPAARILP